MTIGRRSTPDESMADWRLLPTLAILLLLATVFLPPPSVAARGSRETAPEEAPMAGDVEILEGETFKEGARIRARGRIGVYGNDPFTYPALRTEIDANLLEDGTVSAPTEGGRLVPLLLELTGVDPEELDRRQGGPVLVTGVIRRMPQGPRQGLLEVISLESP